MRFRVLGPLEVRAPDAAPVEVGSPKLRTVLTLLLAEGGRTVPVDRIVDELWGDRPPATATGTVQTYVSHLRRLLHTDPPPVLLTRAPGYVLTADASTLDLLAFPGLVDTGGAATRPACRSTSTCTCGRRSRTRRACSRPGTRASPAERRRRAAGARAPREPRRP